MHSSPLPTILFFTAISRVIFPNSIVIAFSIQAAGFIKPLQSSFSKCIPPSFQSFLSDDEPAPEDLYLKFLDRRYHRLHDNESILKKSDDSSLENAKIMGSVIAELSNSQENTGLVSDALPEPLAHRATLRSVHAMSDSLFILGAASDAIECLDNENPSARINAVSASNPVFEVEDVAKNYRNPVLYYLSRLLSVIKSTIDTDMRVKAFNSFMKAATAVLSVSIVVDAIGIIRSKISKKTRLTKSLVVVIALAAIAPIQVVLRSALNQQ